MPARVIHAIGLVAAILLPFWNLPLILRIQQRRSSQDLSMAWALGVFGCLLAMLPAGLGSPDPVFRAFTVVNLLCFTAVVVQVLRYRRPR